METRFELFKAMFMAGAGIAYFVMGTVYITSKVFTTYNLPLM